MSEYLSGRVVAVTGASGRLGRLAVAAFEREGAQVAALVRGDAEARLVPVVSGSTVRSFTCDVTHEPSVRNTFDGIGETFGRLDVLVQTVGAWGSRPFLDTSLDDWKRLIGLNLTTTMLCFREAARLMSAGEGGRLIGIASAQGADAGRAGQAAYSAAKAGIIRLVEAVQEELGAAGITAYAIAPSTIRYEGDPDGVGIAATDVVDLLLRIAGPDGPTLAGQTHRMYGLSS